MLSRNTTATNSTFGSSLQAGDSASHSPEETQFTLELSFLKRTHVIIAALSIHMLLTWKSPLINNNYKDRQNNIKANKCLYLISDM